MDTKDTPREVDLQVDCDQNQDRIEDLVAGELPADETARLLEHLRRCASCGELFDLHARLSAWEMPEPDVQDAELTAVRQAVLSRLEDEGHLRPRGVLPFPASRWQGPGPALTAALAAVFALALLGAGWWAGRTVSIERTPVDARLAAADTAFDPAWLRPASLGPDASLQDYELHNVEIRAVDDATVSLSFDVANRVETLRAKDDPLVTEALVQSILGASALGPRLSAISQASGSEGSLPPRVREALVQAMLEDPALPVRQQAQSQLAQAMPDPEIEAALLQVLEKESSVHMRLVAIDILGARGVAGDRLQRAVEAGQPEPGNALRVRASDYLARQ